MNPFSYNLRRWLLPFVKLLIVALLAWFMSDTIRQAIEQIEHEQVTLEYGWLVAAGVLYLLGQLPSGMYWHRVLNRLGQTAHLGETLRAYYIGNLGKYVPGKALVIIIRTALIRSERVDTAVAAVSVFVETLTMMAVGAALSAAIIAAEFHENWQLLIVSVGLLLLAGIPTLPPVFRRVIRLFRVGRANPRVLPLLDRLDYGTLALGWVEISLGWVALGFSLWATLRGMGVELELLTNLPLLIAAVALAIVAGFASLIPGGAFVRELVLTELLMQLPGVTKGQALLSAVVLRLVTLVAEAGISGILWFMGAKPKKPFK